MLRSLFIYFLLSIIFCNVTKNENEYIFKPSQAKQLQKLRSLKRVHLKMTVMVLVFLEF